ncbi:alcohol dehydrogenase catalytic domain-containing protein [Amycolatopsis sp. CA-128772]|uniref:alcohol dehydrogenase catalytic domain-containing protein n=1 Tax=Amycolatopsis sp. CA-128772 TaxID=2073159 RepID=UPI0018EC4B2E|nr:alcohol dehydrogenase catalytic domain-containing protein [Amycolatopsis sp. CA-128772]
MDQHRAAQVRAAGGTVTVRPVTARPPEAGEVRVDVRACGVCGADAGTAADSSPPAGFPITPGHEIAGVIAETGTEVAGWRVGDRVTAGWFGGSCGHCAACRSGDVVHCPRRRIPGLSYPGGWSTTITVPATTLAGVPDALPLDIAAPFGCAGVTTFTALRHGGAQPGDRVAVVGIGGLGHLAVQFAAAMGFETVAVGRGEDKRKTAADLGAHHYVDGSRDEPGQVLRELGGCRLILSTASSTAPLAGLLDGLAPHGRLVVAGLDGAPVSLPLGKLVMHARAVTGHLTGSPVDTEQAMRFAVATGVRPWVEPVPLDDASDALDDLKAGRARFRKVLVP